ncbi:hypothetical protein [uncultured Metabacillus sp.]|uniref:hypothetical protein n=1 Tax=uncultured Metabacillus sp. TaxID=2860135 RepID=UPI00260B0C8A|nr:hypothetical protein [uncultured Metabacillus sp.]
MRFKATEEIEKFILEQYVVHRKSMREIQRLVGANSPNTIKNILNKHQVEGRSLSESRKKYSCSLDFFKEIDSEDKAYWLGFIMADGCVTKKTYKNSSMLKITLKVNDIKHLEKFKNAINGTYPIRKYEQQTNYGLGKYCEIKIQDDIFCSHLNHKGVVPNKSLILKYPNISNEYSKDFIRGYFDGDGSITLTTTKDRNSFGLNIIGTKDILLGIIKNLNLSDKHIYEINSYYLISIGGNKQVYTILNYLYEDANIFLDRKYNRYLLLKQQQL